ncbi:hypothetical protein [Rhizobium leguminosarum]
MQRTVVIELVDFQSIISTKRPPAKPFHELLVPKATDFLHGLPV